MKLAFLVLLVLAVTLGTAGCAQPPGGVAGNPNPPATSGGTPAVGAAVFTDPGAYAGQTVRVDAVYQGYRVEGCRFAPAARSTALTRSDWVAQREANCLFVTGGAPAGVDPLDPSAAGRRVEMTARVIDGGDGRFLLQLVEARLAER